MWSFVNFFQTYFSLSLFITVLLIVYVLYYRKNTLPIFNIYQQPNGFYWLKVVFMFLILSFKKITIKRLSTSKIKEIEAPQLLPKNGQAADAVYFSGATKNGDYLVVATARRPNHLVDGFMYLKLNNSDLGLLLSPNLPDTSLYVSEECQNYTAEGIKIEVIEPMQTWKVTYQGKMKEENSPAEHKVILDGIWTSDSPYFSYDTDIDPWAMAKCMSLEKWGRAYFDNLKKSHQTHYEQYGKLKATIKVDEKSYNIEFDTLRDHTVAEKREWRNFRRYAMHFFTTENGDHFTVGFICLPISFSRLLIGFVYSAQDEKVFPVTSSDFELYKFGELGTPPTDYGFTFTAGGKTYTVQVNVVDAPYFYISKDWEAKIFEMTCRFKVNGKKGWGISEWQYRNIQGKLK